MSRLISRDNNSSKTQMCAFPAEKDPVVWKFFVIYPRSNFTLPSGSKYLAKSVWESIGEIQPKWRAKSWPHWSFRNVQCGQHAAFTSSQQLESYKAQMRPHVEYCSHLWTGVAKTSSIYLIPWKGVKFELSRIQTHLQSGEVSAA